MLVRLRELDELKSDFVAITSHELRTPLTAVRGFVDALRRRHAELSVEEVQEYLMIIHSQTDRLIRLVEDLLLISRIEAGKLTFMPHPVNTNSLLIEACQGLGELGDRVETSSSSRDAPSDLVVDGQRLIQVLTNLLMNAIKFSPPDAKVELRDGVASDGHGHVRGARPRARACRPRSARRSSTASIRPNRRRPTRRAPDSASTSRGS